MLKIAIILFPGTNCENETMRAVEAAGMTARIVRWNDTAGLDKYDGYILPGGFSYEDRIRAGVISAKDPIMEVIRKQAAGGKVVLGICNGCQVLIESGIVPLEGATAQMAMAPNINPVFSGYYCTWVYIRNATKKKTAFNLKMNDDEIIRIPIAHGEGRFVTADKAVRESIIMNDLAHFKYCSPVGDVMDEYPVNPNGSMLSIAGITNKRGNVLAMMPHPERSSWKHQVPGNHANGDVPGPGRKIFESIREYLK
ncbi:MAG: phosphoribosylformylglycinamidine synthase I [archaeon]